MNILIVIALVVGIMTGLALTAENAIRISEHYAAIEKEKQERHELALKLYKGVGKPHKR